MDGVVGVSGKGMMIGISLAAPLTSVAVVPACIAAGLIVLSAKEKVRLLPPLTIEKAEIDAGLAILQKVLLEQKELLEREAE
jgi:acetylornithine/N-succinyldiaminopimelate aminotransferase